MNETILEVRDLTKTYGPVTALDDFSISLFKGEVLGLLGPNGAGKTTLISILSGTLKDFQGMVLFQGENLFGNCRLKKAIGIVPQEMAFYEELNASENLAFFARLYGLGGHPLKERVAQMLRMVELEDRDREPVKNFSGGMKRRLNLAIGLLHRPELLLLDEPTVGIDVHAKVKILDIIRSLGREGTSVIFTTHQLAEVEDTCTRIAVMDKGAVLVQGTLNELIQIVGEKVIVAIEGLFAAERIHDLMKNETFFETLMIRENFMEMAFERSEKIPRLVEMLIGKGISISDIKIKTPSLETVFLKLTGRSLRD